MAPIFNKKEVTISYIDALIKNNKIIIFSKASCPYCNKVKEIFNKLETQFIAIELDELDPADTASMLEVLQENTKMSTVPNIFIEGKHIGGSSDLTKLYENQQLIELLNQPTINIPNYNSHVMDVVEEKYDFDLIVIGGGSGGLAASKEAAKLGAKVALLDFVKPTPKGHSWGIGGTCVNVGCIPKKMMHLAAIVGNSIADGPVYGWKVTNNEPHDWNTLVQVVQDRIKSSNWGYRVALRDSSVTYFNEFGEFIDAHSVKTIDKKGTEHIRTAKTFIIAVGGRPRYPPDVQGAKEYAITSDDVFSLKYHPGKTLVVGASYIALETAGFLGGLGIDTTVMVRSILLRGFDQQVAEFIGSYMKEHGNIKFQRRRIPISLAQLRDGEPPALLVKSKDQDGTEYEEEFNTVIFAVGRYPVTKDLCLEKVGVIVEKGTEKILANDSDQTSVPNIFAIGDCVQNRPELTPSAIQAGLLLARRLYQGDTTKTDYKNCATTIFTPFEYGCIGLSEEDAIVQYGQSDIEVYHSYFQPFESALPYKDLNKCYSKLICVKSLNERVVGFHFVGPNAGEVTQGFALAMRLGATKSDFNSTIGIHPTSAENFTITLDITKSSGKDATKKGCCG